MREHISHQRAAESDQQREAMLQLMNSINKSLLRQSKKDQFDYIVSVKENNKVMPVVNKHSFLNSTHFRYVLQCVELYH